MIAYRKDWLRNLAVNLEAKSALEKQLITEQERVAIGQQYPVGFYMPHYFIRLGLFFLTLLVICFLVALLGFFVFDLNESSLKTLAFVTALAAYISLEWVVKTKLHYASGIDDGLMWAAIFAFVIGGWAVFDLTDYNIALLAFFVCGFFALRFVDILVSLMAWAALASFFYFTLIKMGMADLIPFILMGYAAVSYFLLRKFNIDRLSNYYYIPGKLLEYFSLFLFYASGNYFVVRELQQLISTDKTPIFLYGNIFWALTFIVPLFYIFFGIRRRNRLFIHCGVLLIAAIVFTWRQYHYLMPLEICLTISGAILIAACWSLFHYLKLPKHGFSSRSAAGLPATDNDALIVSETFQPQEEITPRFGGGSFGGGGTTGSY
ncbi:MAG: hypothetical protein JWQ27_1609 [Ferruginibacter sp.]|nr:hypothetical protein [Ferruginibacter sp.]